MADKYDRLERLARAAQAEREANRADPEPWLRLDYIREYQLAANPAVVLDLIAELRRLRIVAACNAVGDLIAELRAKDARIQALEASIRFANAARQAKE